MSDDLTPRRVRVARAMPEHGLRAGQAAWVAGSAIDSLLEDGSLVDITARAQRQRLWRVGARTYANRRQAVRVAEATGQTAVEVA